MKSPALFDASVHLDYRPPSKRFSLTELGIDAAPAFCDFAHAEPFQLLSEEGIRASREEIFSDPVQRNCKFTSKRTPSVLCGTTKHSQLLKGLWYSPETGRCIAKAAGQPTLIVHALEYEIGHTNLQEASSNAPVDDWHKDSLPFVIVLLLSDISKAKGGATIVRKGDDTEVPIKIPKPGWAIIMQGQHVEHLAERAVGVDERTTMVTATILVEWRFPDNYSLKAGRTCSWLPELYHQWAVYCLQTFAKRASAMQGDLARRRASGQSFDASLVKSWYSALIEHLHRT